MASFNVEVPGEANPLTENLLVHTLKSASSTDPQQIQTGTQQLQTWEKSPNYYVHLQSAFVDRRLPVETRYLAIIQLKNGIDKYWRKTATNAVSKEDKAVIRQRLIQSGLDEPDNRLALQNALVTAKIIRFEYPNDWPDALPSIISTLRTASDGHPFYLQRALLIALHATKELSTGRLQRTRQTLQAITPELVHVLAEIYASRANAWMERDLSIDPAQVQGVMAQSLLALKVFRRLLISGYEHPNRDAEITSIWTMTSQHVVTLLDFSKAGIPDSSMRTMVEKHTLQLAKLHYDMAKSHPAAFALFPDAFSLVQTYWTLVKGFGQTFGSQESVASAMSSARIGTDGDADEHDKSTLEKVVLRSLLIVRACLKMVHSPAHTFKYRQPEDKEEKTRATELIRSQLLTQSFVQEAMEVAVTKYFVFRASDLREWEEEPEEWEKREEGGESDDWEFSIRPCAEKLFLDLAINYKDTVIPPLLQVFYSAAKLDNEDVLFKDSIYTAIGLAAPALHDQFDFDSFVRETLVTETQKIKPGYSVLRRRAAILLGQWMPIKIAKTTQPLVHLIFQHLLNKDDSLNDQVVRVTAGRQFNNIANDWEFDAEQFLPFADTILTRLMQLIEEVELPETKMALLNTISIIVERLEKNIGAFAERIVSLLPPLWEQSGDEHLMKQAILTILARLIHAMKAASTPFHPLVTPIIKGAVEPGSDTQVYLLEDALDLWAAILVQTPAPASPELLDLSHYLFSIFELGSENLRKALEIAESYLLLAPSYFLSDEMRAPLFASLTSLIGTLRPDANGLVCNLVEQIIRTAHRLGGEDAVSQTVHDLRPFLTTILQGLHGSWRAHCTTGPLAKDPPVDGIVETDYLSILARIMLGSTPSFLQLSATFTPPPTENQPQNQPSPSPLESTLHWLLEESFNHFDNIADPSRRKLLTLALTSLLTTAQPFILSNLQNLMTLWTSVITELRDSYDETATSEPVDRLADCLVYQTPAPATAEEAAAETPEDARRRELENADVVRTVPMAEGVRHFLSLAVQEVGGEGVFADEWVGNVDRDVVGAFGALGVM
ncbi:hypothetical protein MBLNU230_g7797t1 [Neophaeotheca triangularis]